MRWLINLILFLLMWGKIWRIVLRYMTCHHKEGEEEKVEYCSKCSYVCESEIISIVSKLKSKTFH